MTVRCLLEARDHRPPMRIQGGRAVYQHHSGTTPVQSICDARAIDVHRACCCHQFILSIIYMTTITRLMRDMTGGNKSKAS